MLLFGLVSIQVSESHSPVLTVSNFGPGCRLCSVSDFGTDAVTQTGRWKVGGGAMFRASLPSPLPDWGERGRLATHV